MAAEPQTFDELVQDGLALAFRGWDFAAIGDRWTSDDPPWDYRAVVQERLPAAALLDMGTGGGEFLSTLTPRPPLTCATESYAPNVAVARERLAPLGISVHVPPDDEYLPFADATFDRVINRHESYAPREVWRVLRPGGLFITQQVGERDNVQLNEALAAPATAVTTPWSLDFARAQLTAAGFTILRGEEAFPPETFTDIGAVVFCLRIIAWQIPDFTVAAYRPQLEALHDRITAQGSFVTLGHRFLLVARKPLA